MGTRRAHPDLDRPGLLALVEALWSRGIHECRALGVELLDLYGLYKQATEGDVAGSRPGMLDLKGRAKFDAWSKRKGTSKDEAGQNWIRAVPTEQVLRYMKELIEFLDARHPGIAKAIAEKKALDDGIKKDLDGALREFRGIFQIQG